MKATTTAALFARMTLKMAQQLELDIQQAIGALGKINEALNLVDGPPERKSRAKAEKERVQTALLKAEEARVQLVRLNNQACALPADAVVEMTGPEMALFSFATSKDGK